MKKMVKKDNKHWLYLGLHKISNLYKIGITTEPTVRTDELNIDLMKYVEFNSKSEAERAEKTIQIKYKHFRVTRHEALIAGVNKNGSTEYYSFTSSDQGEYVLDHIAGNESKFFTSPFSLYWMSVVFQVKLKAPQLRVVDTLTRFTQSRDAVIDNDNLNALIEIIKLDGEVKIPIILNSESMVLSGNHRLRACKAIGLQTLPVIYADEAFLGDKEQLEISLLVNNFKNHEVCKLISPADVKRDIAHCLNAHKKTFGCSLEDSWAHFNAQIDQLVTKYHLSKNVCNRYLGQTLLKLEEDNAVDVGLFKPGSLLDFETIRQSAVEYHGDTAVIVHIATKVNDMVGAVIRAMHDEGKKKGLVLTYKSYSKRHISNANDLVYLASLKKKLGLEISIEEIPQLTISETHELTSPEPEKAIKEENYART
jgi:hypothetical protein